MKLHLLIAFLIASISCGAQMMVKDIYQGPGSSHPINFVTIGNTTFFVASDSVHGFELWKTDGTEAGTQMVKDIAPGADDGLYYNYDDPIYSTLYAMGNDVFFFANDDSTGFELWKSDGTDTGTVQVKDIYPGSAPSVSSPEVEMMQFGNYLYFAAQSSDQDMQLWRTDGTTAGTTLVKHIADGGSFPNSFFVNGSTMYFSAYADSVVGGLFKTDGTAQGTQLVKNTYPNGQSDVSGFTAFNNEVYFAAADSSHGYELWVTDGTEAGTQLAVDIAPGPFGGDPQELTVLGNKMVFVGDDLTHGTELWTTDGTPGGTMLLKDINPSPGVSSYPYYLTLLGNQIFFEADDSVHGQEMWVTDGTAQGTKLFLDINPAATQPSNPDNLTVVNGKLYFVADDGTHGREAWQSDGTVNGTMMIGDICPGACDADPFGFTANNNFILFDATTTDFGAELYRLGTTTEIKPVSVTPGFRIQPNPAKDYITIITDENFMDASLQLIDIAGREVLSSTLESSTAQLNTSTLPGGLYFVKLSGRQGVVGVQKVIVQ